MQVICLHQLSSAYDSGSLSTLIKSVHYASHLSKLFEPVLKAGALSTLVSQWVTQPAYGWLRPVFKAPLTPSPGCPFCPFPHAQRGSRGASPSGSLSFPTSYSNLSGRGWLRAGSGVDVGQGDTS